MRELALVGLIVLAGCASELDRAMNSCGRVTEQTSPEDSERIYNCISHFMGKPESEYAKASYRKKAPIQPGTELLVLSTNCNTEYGYVEYSGEVKNVSDRRLSDVMVVATFRTASGELVKSDKALIEYNPIMPGQTSPFRVISSDTPSIKKCSVGFKTISGRAISFED